MNDDKRAEKTILDETEYTIREAKEALRSGIRAYLSEDADGNDMYPEVNRIPFYLEGAPGIGKTEIVRQIAEEMGIGFVSFSVTHHTRNTLIGLPVIKDLPDGGRYTEYTMSEIIASVKREEEGGMEKGILLLDEFNCASETIMPTMLAFLQTRNIGLYRLPSHWIMVLCGNPKEYNVFARQFTPAILDRVRLMRIVPSSVDFLDYAAEKQFHPEIRSFLEINPESAYRVQKKDHENRSRDKPWLGKSVQNIGGV